ncbi:unnamed protein product, partial [Ixodes hexagonus]
PGVLLKHVTWNGDRTLIGLIDTGSYGCLLRAPVTARCGAQLSRETTALYGFGNKSAPAARTIGTCRADLEIDGVIGRDIPILVFPDEAQSVDLLVGRTFTELLYITYARVGGCLRFWKSDCPFTHLK